MINSIKKNFSIFITFITIIAILLFFNMYKFNSIFLYSPDGELYLSIAKNFLENGRFIQNTRQNEINMIVPPGISYVYLFLLSIFKSKNIIILIQYLLHAFSIILFACTNFLLFNNKRYVFFLSIVVFLLFNYKIMSPNPGYLGIETYSNFTIILIYYYMFNHKMSIINLNLLLCFALFLFLLRPACVGITIFVIYIYIKNILKLKVFFKSTVFIFISFIIILLINVYVNYRETGHIVMLENYSGSSTYLANNSNSKTYEYSSTSLNDFADDVFLEIYYDNSIDEHVKNQKFAILAKNYIQNNKLITFKRYINKAINYFLCLGKKGFILYFVSIIASFFIIKKRIWLKLMIMMVLLFLPLPMGLYIPRYFSNVYIFLAAFVVAFLYGIINMCLDKIYE